MEILMSFLISVASNLVIELVKEIAERRKSRKANRGKHAKRD